MSPLKEPCGSPDRRVVLRSNMSLTDRGCARGGRKTQGPHARVGNGLGDAPGGAPESTH